MKIDSVVLAGRPNTGKLSSVSNEPLEANIEIAGRPMVSYVLAALSGVPDVSKVLLVGPKDGLGRYESDRIVVVEPGEDLIENIRIGLEKASTEYVLVCSSDIPLITSDILADFLEKCISIGVDFVYPVSRKEDCEARYPGVKRTYVKLKDGTFTGGNVFFVRKAIVDNAWPMVEKMVTYRKSPLKMASFLGFGLLLRIALGLSGVQEIENHVGKLLGITCKALIGASPEMSVDVDKPLDLEICRLVLEK